MKRVIRLTESDLERIVKRIITESTEGVDAFIDKILEWYESEDLKQHIGKIRDFIDASGCKKIEFANLMGGALGLATHNGVVFSPAIFNKSLQDFLFIIFHEILHQYQYKKYGIEKMYDYYLGDISVKEAAVAIKDIEMVADEFAARKVREFIKLGVINKIQSSNLGVYKTMDISYFEGMLVLLKKMLKERNITDYDEVADFFYKIAQQPIRAW
jgi:hypothetical protein